MTQINHCIKKRNETLLKVQGEKENGMGSVRPYVQIGGTTCKSVAW